LKGTNNKQQRQAAETDLQAAGAARKRADRNEASSPWDPPGRLWYHALYVRCTQAAVVIDDRGGKQHPAKAAIGVLRTLLPRTAPPSPDRTWCCGS